MLLSLFCRPSHSDRFEVKEKKTTIALRFTPPVRIGRFRLLQQENIESYTLSYESSGALSNELVSNENYA